VNLTSVTARVVCNHHIQEELHLEQGQLYETMLECRKFQAPEELKEGMGATPGLGLLAKRSIAMRRRVRRRFWEDV
jgi:hypothetical protein